MKKKIWILIIILITAGVCVAAYFIWFADKKKLYHRIMAGERAILSL